MSGPLARFASPRPELTGAARLAEMATDHDAELASIRAQIPGHPALDVCPDGECMVCGLRDCPKGEPGHYWHDGCPACDTPEPATTRVQPSAPPLASER